MQSIKKPTILLSCFHPFVVRNILQSGTLEIFKRECEKVVIVAANYNADRYKELFESDNVVIEVIDFKGAISSRRERVFQRFSDLLLDTLSKKHHKLIQLERTKNYPIYFLRQFITKIGGNFTVAKKMFRRADFYGSQPKVFDEIVQKHSPDVIFATEVYGEADVILLKAAKRLGIKCLAMVRSWDNPTTKTLMRIVPDRLIVQNEVQKDECNKFHHVPLNSMLLSGIPQFEYFLNYKPSSRTSFFEQIGADANKKLILLAPAGEKFIDTDWKICEIIKSLKVEGIIPPDLQFLIRIHPGNYADFSKFNNDPDFIIEDPSATITYRRKEAELSMSGINHLADSIYHSDIVINILSSIVLDAVVFDKPMITISFTGQQNVPYLRTVERNHKELCFQKLFSVNACPLAHNKNELARLINEYLENPELHSENRKKLVTQQFWKLDGHAAERIAGHVIDYAHS